MREILFRGKRVDNGEWVISDCVFQCSGKIKSWDEPNRDGWVEVIPKIVGQYTGIKDKNGKKIFEGDIVVYAGDKHEVVFETKNNSAYFGIKISEVETWEFGNYVEPNSIEVIGNIHDNPELLEVEE